jgi:hypothetical protein
LRFGWFTHKEQRQVARSFTDEGFNPSARVSVRELEQASTSVDRHRRVLRHKTKAA